MMTGSDSDDGVSKGGGGSKQGRRLRYYALDLKRRIVEETFGPGQSVSIVARRHDVNSNLVFAWRKQYREGRLGKRKPAAKATPSSASQDLIHIGVLEPRSVLCPPPVGSKASEPDPSAHRAHEAPVPERDSTTLAGIIDIELPNRVKVRVDADIGEAALRRVLAAARQLA